MQAGCKEVYTIKEVEQFCTPKEVELYSKINQDVIVGKNKNLKWCCNIECDSIVKRSRCPCKNKVNCEECSQAMCFECGEAWHTGSCKNGIDANYAAFKLLATCPKCKAPVEKNGACNMMSCRCGVGFCWICREDTGHNYDHFRFTKLSWHLGCSRLIGDTALGQCIHMIIELFLLPIVVIPEGQFLLFKKLATRCESIICLADTF